jgi:predicted Rossmann fold flavoprotein
VIVGAGAAGLTTAIFARQANPGLDVRLLDGAAKPGAKILVSGGARCNVTNAVVTEADYWGGKRTIIRRVLAKLPVARTIAFFREIGVPLKEEHTGKLFPVSDRSRDVLEALLRTARETGVTISTSTRVHDVSATGSGFVLHTSQGVVPADRLVLATGGLSLPKTGSDGGGLAIARHLGHTIVPTTPALVPLVLEDSSPHAALSGVAQDVELTLYDERGTTLARIPGAMLWTHFGISGPAALDVSRHFLRARLEGGSPTLAAAFAPGVPFEALERRWIDAVRARPRAALQTVLSESLPSSVAGVLVQRLEHDVGKPPAARLADLGREERRWLVHSLSRFPLPVRDSRGYNYAEATAGGVSLDEIEPSTMASRRCPGLFLVGEMLDVDGRLGGFNFQWAWASARAAAEGLASAGS